MTAHHDPRVANGIKIRRAEHRRPWVVRTSTTTMGEMPGRTDVLQPHHPLVYTWAPCCNLNGSTTATHDSLPSPLFLGRPDNSPMGGKLVCAFLTTRVADRMQASRKLVALGDGGCGKVREHMGGIWKLTDDVDVTVNRVYKRCDLRQDGYADHKHG